MNRLTSHKWLWGGLLVVAILVAVAVVATIFTERQHQETPVATLNTSSSSSAVATNPDISPGSSVGDTLAPNFQLRDQQGRLTSLAQFRGKVVVLAFIDARCTTICPLTTQSMLDALQLLGPAASDVQLLAIDANPLAIRVADVAAYTRAHQMQGRWRFVTGSLPELKQVWRRYHVYVAAVHNEIDHTPIVILIGRQGLERRIYVTQMSYAGVSQQAELLARGIAQLLPSHPALRRAISLHYRPPPAPSATVKLRSVGGKPVLLGPHHPHLLLFFAGWLKESTPLAAGLAVLDHYAATARRQGWPAPVAVDEVTTESSPVAAQHILANLHTTLHIPLTKDPAGRIADGYHVQGLPWFVLTSGSGQILWQHEGWLSAAALEHQVRKSLKH